MGLEEREFVVIGAGPAGLRAALTAARSGVKVTVIGEDPQHGGQIFRQLTPPLQFQGHVMELQDQLILEELQNDLAKTDIQFLHKSLVWGIFDENVIALNKSDGPLIKAKKILIAEGAYEAPVAFPGWTLPGVMTVGGVQILVKSQGIIPTGKIIVAGTGPLLFYTASQLVRNGADVRAVLEASSLSQWMIWTMKLWRAPGVFLKGLKYINILKKHHVPVHYNTVPLEARGEESLEEVIVSRVDKQWRPRSGSEKKIAADLLCLNFGFIPSTQFSHMAGCEHRCDPRIRGWLPKIDSKNETSVKGIFAAGDCTGVGGVKKAVLEGALVGNEVARQLGRFPGEDADKQIRVLQKKLRRRLWYQHFLEDIYAFRPGLLDLVTDETTICRCEEVDFGTISDLIEKETSSLEEIKLRVRTGMGRCQGRFCYPTLLGFLSKTLPNRDLCLQDFTARVPVKPLPLEKFTDLSSPK